MVSSVDRLDLPTSEKQLSILNHWIAIGVAETLNPKLGELGPRQEHFYFPFCCCINLLTNLFTGRNLGFFFRTGSIKDKTGLS